MKRVLVTGSRDWTNTRLVQAVLDEVRDILGEQFVVVHGKARGLDRIAAVWARRHGTEDPYPADWDSYGKAAGAIRNAEMVAAGAIICLAFPLPDSRGTLDCMEKAEAAGIPVVNFGRPNA